MGGWSQAASKLLNQNRGGVSIAPFASGPGGTIPKNLLTSPGYFQPPNQDFANQLFGRKSGQQQQLFLADILAQLGIGAGAAGAQTLQQPLNYYSSLLSGDRQGMLETVAPEVNTILGQYDTAKRAVSEYAPRGGGSASQLANEPYALSGQITNLLNQVRPQAAAATTDIGKFLDTLGTTQTGQAGGLINANTLAQLGKTGQQSAYAGLLGSALGGILPSLLGLIPHGTPTDTLTNPILPDVPSAATIPPVTAAPTVGGAVPSPSWSLYPGATPPLVEEAAGTAGEVAGTGATAIGTSGIGGAGGLLGAEPIAATEAGVTPFAGAGAATGTAGGIEGAGSEAFSSGFANPFTSQIYGSGVNEVAGAPAAESTGGGLLGATGPAAIGGGLALGAGLPLAVLGLLGIGPSQIFGGVPSKGTQQNILKTEAPVYQSMIDSVKGATNLGDLNKQYQYVKQFIEGFAKSMTGGFANQQAQQYLQMLQQAYQQQLQKIQASGT